MDKSYEGKVVLLVDDDQDFLDQMWVNMRALGFSILKADSQAAAEEILKDTKFDLAIIDLMMENMDGGFVLSYKIKQKYPTVPVIMVTGVAAETGLSFDSTTKDERSWIKADVVLSKPVRLEQLRREMHRLL